MAGLDGFDANVVEPNQSFEAIPVGDYLCTITGSEEKPTKDGKNKFINLEFTVQEGSYKGRKLWERLFLKHPNEDTVRIAKGKLSSICRAVGVMRPRDSVELHNLPLIVKVGLQKRKSTDPADQEPRNDLKDFKPRSAGKAASAAPAAAPAAAPTGGADTAPWRKA